MNLSVSGLPAIVIGAWFAVSGKGNRLTFPRERRNDQSADEDELEFEDD